MYGILDSIASGPVEARLSEKSTMASFCIVPAPEYYQFLNLTGFCCLIILHGTLTALLP